jgi:hypothetical protein
MVHRGGVDPDERAPDIKDLEKMLNIDAASDDELSDRAIEIFERLLEAGKKARRVVDREPIEKQIKDFERVTDDIIRRRSTHVLDKFYDYLRKNDHMLSDDEKD